MLSCWLGFPTGAKAKWLTRVCLSLGLLSYMTASWHGGRHTSEPLAYSEVCWLSWDSYERPSIAACRWCWRIGWLADFWRWHWLSVFLHSWWISLLAESEGRGWTGDCFTLWIAEYSHSSALSPIWNFFVRFHLCLAAHGPSASQLYFDYLWCWARQLRHLNQSWASQSRLRLAFGCRERPEQSLAWLHLTRLYQPGPSKSSCSASWLVSWQSNSCWTSLHCRDQSQSQCRARTLISLCPWCPSSPAWPPMDAKESPYSRPNSTRGSKPCWCHRRRC